jgi:hypothetical protein
MEDRVMEYGIAVWPWEDVPGEVKDVVPPIQGFKRCWVAIFYDLTPDAAKRFQEEHKIFNADNIQYKTYIGYTTMIGYNKSSEQQLEPQKEVEHVSEAFTIDLPEGVQQEQISIQEVSEIDTSAGA